MREKKQKQKNQEQRVRCAEETSRPSAHFAATLSRTSSRRLRGSGACSLYVGAEENFDEPGHVRGDSDATLEPDTIARKGSRASQLAAGWGRRSCRKEKKKGRWDTCCYAQDVCLWECPTASAPFRVVSPPLKRAHYKMAASKPEMRRLAGFEGSVGVREVFRIIIAALNCANVGSQSLVSELETAILKPTLELSSICTCMVIFSAWMAASLPRKETRNIRRALQCHPIKTTRKNQATASRLPKRVLQSASFMPGGIYVAAAAVRRNTHASAPCLRRPECI